MTDDDIQYIASEFSVWTEQGWAVVDKVAFAREIERRTLERAKQLCLDREKRVDPVTKGDCEWMTGLTEGIKTGARHCACEIDEAIRALEQK